MQNIIRLLLKFQVILFFVLLQFICFILLISGRNSFHQASIASSSNTLVGTFYTWTSSVSNYFHLEEENAALILENVKMKKQLLGHQIVVGKTYIKVNDTIYYQQYDFISAKVINSSITAPKHNVMTINVGAESQVGSEMGVVGSRGVIGVTMAVSNSFATVKPIINADFILPVRHANSKVFGRVIWAENDTYVTATVIDIPSSVAVDIGDLIETRGAEGIFPEGIPVGKVIAVELVPGETYHHVKIGLLEDFSSVYHVSVVKNIKREEQLQLEEQTNSSYIK